MSHHGPVVEISNLNKSYGTQSILRDLNLTIQRGEILTLLGPSGCGKSTLMRIVAGFESMTRGDLTIDGKSMVGVPPERRPVNMVFQKYALFPHLDVFDNVAFGLRLKRLPAHEIRKRCLEMLELVQLTDLSNRWIHQISGGQAQRVALARALANRPAVLLLDEPLAALDLKIRQYMVAELKRIHAETGTTFLFVTHDQDEAITISDRIVLMNRGAIEQIDTPEGLYSAPRSPFAAKFLGETNIFPARLSSGTADGGRYDCGFAHVTARRTSPAGQDCNIVSLRPEMISIVDDVFNSEDNTARGTILSSTFIGSRIVYSVECGNQTIKCQSHYGESQERRPVGASITLRWSAQACIALYDESFGHSGGPVRPQLSSADPTLIAGGQ